MCYANNEQRKTYYTEQKKNNSTSNIKINITITRKQKWEEKQLYRYFKRRTNETLHEKTWQRKGNLKRETKSLIRAEQNDAKIGSKKYIEYI